MLIILLVLAFLLYMKHYVSPSIHFNIVQLPLSKLEPTYLFEKSPIIVNEPFVRPSDLTLTLFKYLFVKKTHSFKCVPHSFQQNKSRYLILYPKNKDSTVKIVHPKKSKFLFNHTDDSLKSIEYVEIKLRKRQVIILPMQWWYQTEDPDHGRIELDDLYSFFIQKIRG